MVCQQVTEGTKQGTLPKWLRLLWTSVRPWRLERKGLLRMTDTEFPHHLVRMGWGSLRIDVSELKKGGYFL